MRAAGQLFGLDRREPQRSSGAARASPSSGGTRDPSGCLSRRIPVAESGAAVIRGAGLPDPKQILLGSGNQTRFVRIESVEVLARPEIEALVATAIAQSKTPLPANGPAKLIIRSVSAKQRPRRRSAK